MNNSFESLCLRMEKNMDRSLEENEIAYARFVLHKYINGNKDRYLKLKAEIESIMPFYAYASYTVSVCVMIISAFSFLTSIFGQIGVKDYSLVFVGGMFVFLVMAVRILDKQRIVYKWRGYISTVMKEISWEDSRVQD